MKNETGKRYDSLLVLQMDKTDQLGRMRWWCRCDCGNIVSIRGDNLRTGNTTKCVECGLLKL